MLLSELPFDKHKISWIQLITKYFKTQLINNDLKIRPVKTLPFIKHNVSQCC